MNNKIILESLAMDLKRVSIGFHRGSFGMAKRFLQEALKRKREVDLSEVKPYIRNLLKKVENLSDQEDQEKIAEDTLMLSTLFQNYTQKFLS